VQNKSLFKFNFMKNYFSSLLFFFSTILVFGQNSSKNDISRMAIAPFVSDQIENFPIEAKNLLLQKLNQIVTAHGMSGSANLERFIITANVSVLSKDITPTAPAQHSYTLDVHFYIGDGFSGKVYSSVNNSYIGIAPSETKAYIDALKQIKSGEKIFVDFVKEAKNRIIEYYNSQCDFILKDAQTLAGTKKYDEAIYTLASVPEVCKECYDKCLDKIIDVYKAKIENECQLNISQAKTLMAQNNFNDAASVLSTITPDMQCYTQAASVVKEINDHRCAVSLGEAKGYWVSHDVTSTSSALSSIPSDSKCYEDALALAKEVEDYVRQQENRDFKVMKEQMQNEKEIELARLKAARDVGVAYGSNQPKTITTYNIKGWW
jgi:hypothetical protein